MRRSAAVAVLAIVVGACSTGGADEPGHTVVSTITSPAPPSLPPATTGAPTATSRAPSTTVPATTTPTTTTSVPLDPLQGLALEPVTDGLSQPTVVIPALDGENLLVAERAGRVVRLLEEGPAEAPFLEVAVAANGIEQGLLGLTLHPSGQTGLRLLRQQLRESHPGPVRRRRRRDGRRRFEPQLVLPVGAVAFGSLSPSTSHTPMWAG